MSTLDRYIALMQAAKDKAQSTLASLDALGATSEAVTDVGHSVGSERYVDGGQQMTDSSESARASTQAIIDQADELIAQAESLKTGGPGDVPPASSATTSDSGSSSSSPQYQVRTGADPKPNPVHATPAHTREPSRKIGDPVKPVETEVPESNAPRRRRLGRKAVEGADDAREFVEEISSTPLFDFDTKFNPWGSEVRTETHTGPTFQAPVKTQDLDAPDVFGTLTMMTALAIDAVSRIPKRGKRSNG